MTTSNNNRTIITVVVAIGLVVIVAALMNMPDQRTPGQKIGQAVDNLSTGNVKAAGRALENRTPAERAADAAHDVGNDLKDATK